MARREQTGQSDGMNPALVGMAAWAVPGLGHWLLGQRLRAVILFVTIMATYWIGTYVGGARYTVDPQQGNTLWFIAQLGVGPQVVALWLATATKGLPSAVPWPDADIAIIYAGIAGLLNMLTILDAVGRAAGDEPKEAVEEHAGS
jgi:hypothetical protein